MPIKVEFQHPLEVQFLLDVLNAATIPGTVVEVAVTAKSDLKRALEGLQQAQQSAEPVPLEMVEEVETETEGGG